MLRTLFVFTSLLCLCGIAQAKDETYNYSCVVNGQTRPLRVDATKNILEWGMYKYTLTDTDNCPRWGWHAEGFHTPVEASFDFCGATQGYAFFKCRLRCAVECKQVVTD